jgi:hypothetical protein
MRKLVWGIAVVLFVQVAFQLAMTADRSDSEYKALNTPLQEPVANPSLAPATDELDTNITPDRPVLAKTYIPHATQPHVILVRYPHRQTVTPATTARLKPVIITYKTYKGPERNEAALFAKARPTGLKTETRRQPEERRSLVAKAMPVIKKPYDWLKAVGSRLR